MVEQLNSINTLIVDDDYDDILLTKELLEECENHKFNIEWCNNYDSGLERLKTNHIDIALIDYRLGKENGIELIKTARERGVKIPFIVLTGQGNLDIDRKGMELGASDYLSKNNLNIISLERSIRYAIHNSRMEEKLRESNQTKDKLFSIVAHDLKNPFGAITSYSEFLLEDIDNLSKNEIKEDVKCIHDLAVNVTELLENLLNWSRIQIGNFNYSPEPFNLQDLVVKVIKLNYNVAQLKNIELSSDLDQAVLVHADIDMIFVVLRNLISNAIKFTPQNGKILLSVKNNNDTVNIAVTDTGIGMSRKQLSELFNIGKTSSTLGTNNEKGTGLGLMLSKELIEKNKGKINVESEIGNGSTFSFTLPSYKYSI